MATRNRSRSPKISFESLWGWYNPWKNSIMPTKWGVEDHSSLNWWLNILSISPFNTSASCRVRKCLNGKQRMLKAWGIGFDKKHRTRTSPAERKEPQIS